MAHHGESWYPIHWAVSCQNPPTTPGRRNGDGGSSAPTEDEEEKQQCCGHSCNDPEILALLLRHGADPNQDTTGAPFRSFCAASEHGSDASPFAAVLAEHGIRPQREGRRRTLSETVKRRPAPKTRPSHQDQTPWLGGLVTRYQGDYGLYRRDVDSWLGRGAFSLDRHRRGGEARGGTADGRR